MDPAAFGTTIIGTDRIRRENEAYERGVGREARTRPESVHVRERLAAALRWTAERLAPAPAAA